MFGVPKSSKKKPKNVKTQFAPWFKHMPRMIRKCGLLLHGETRRWTNAELRL